jgi:segregation and condensation protein B
MPSDRKIIESILLLADEPVEGRVIAQVLEKGRVETEELLRSLSRAYTSDDRGFVLRESGAGWRLYTDPECAPWLERFVSGRSQARLSSAALEVLAIVAYRGPISRSQIAEIRGVDSDRVVKTLTQRDLIAESSRDPGPGGPALFSVSDEFLERMGLTSTQELPPLADFVPDSETVEDMEARLSPRA